jgi:uncharacterized protein (DUF1697 family)
VALVVLLRGVNVGGHRSFRPKALAERLEHLGVVNIGATGTFVVGRRVAHAQLRAQFSRHLPFSAEIAICRGREIRRLLSTNHFGDDAMRPDVTRFVSVLSRKPRSKPMLPMTFPASGEWLLKILGSDSRFIFGVYRRHMKVITYLGMLDRLFGVPVTTRNWNTIVAIANVLAGVEEKDRC